ncbi:tetrapyrrole biosynthesis, uroporphyrinogen III synthase [Thelephora ganbajun]|uniref:Tetrapyrrole biosynthesis, uroporphyrinogen III synthase n=1 Tax=Thelephora ganbajun TaxID=370292 RepID=A0ACB6ZEW3_THEGA|nr:tetrapyrrole biosynthesis, uroporphyrinogen III synthase [Thelephora ganbajun]
MNVLLVRNPPEDTPDRYHQHLQSIGLHPHSVPVLETVYANLGDLRDKVQEKSSGYGGVIMTSSRSAESWDLIRDELSSARRDGMGSSDWSSVPFYTVGTATGNILRKMPVSPFTPSSQNIVGEGSGAGEALAKVIIDDQRGRTPKLPLLYLVGDKNKDTLPTLVQAAGLDLEPLQVYSTRGSPSFSTAVKALFQRRLPLDPTRWWIVFFAPSSAEFALPILREHLAFSPVDESGDDQYGQFCKVAAIGPTTVTHVKGKCGVKVHAVAEKPSPKALGEALLEFG